jgi:CBS domain-containing protein
MLQKLQRRTMIPTQVVGYAVTLLIGVTIVLLSVQLYADLRPVLTQQTDVFRNHAVTLSKNVSLMNSIDKRGIYFTEQEYKELLGQGFIEDVAPFTSSSFEVYASIDFGGQRISTDLFFESIPDEYIDVQSNRWQWDSTSGAIPIIIPEDYLSLYNFGFAESQALPVVSKGAIEQVSFAVTLSGNGRQQRLKGRIAGFSGKINTILVPEAFMLWANGRFGNGERSGVSRLLVEFADASDPRIPAFMESHNYNLKQSELESSKLAFFFRVAMAFVMGVAIVIIILSVAFIIMSLNVVVQRNRQMLTGLYTLGYTPRQMAAYYRRVVGIITLADIAVALAAALLIRSYYVHRIAAIFSIEGGILPIVIATAVVAVVLIVVYNKLILRAISRALAAK